VQGTYRFPVVCDGRVVFVCEDDVWSCPVEGGRAERLTALHGRPGRLVAHPTQPLVAFTSNEEGILDVSLLDLRTGEIRRLTHHGGARVAGWTPDGEVAFSSSRDRPFLRDEHLFAVHPEGGTVRDLGLGIGSTVWWKGPLTLVGRYRDELASWRDYRGGRRGEVWLCEVPEDGAVEATQLLDGGGGLATPAWLGDHVVAASDASGSPQLCRLHADRAPEVLTDHEAPVRFVQPCPGGVVYAAGPDLYRYVVEGEGSGPDVVPVQVDFRSPRPLRARRFVTPSRYLDEADPHPDGRRVVVVVRGKPFVGGWFEGPMRQVGTRHGVRYQLARWVDDGLLVVSDAGGTEQLEVHLGDGGVRKLADLDGGRPLVVQPSPKGDRVAVLDHRGQLWVVPTDGSPAVCLHDGPHASYQPAFSHDGRWVAYVREVAKRGGPTQIVVAPADGGEAVAVTSGAYRDVSPSFDPEGRFLYLISFRVFDPTYDAVRFNLSFPRGSRPFLIPLSADTEDPFRPSPGPLKRPTKRPKPPAELTIDFEGIASRIVAFPVAESRYVRVLGAHGGRVWMLRKGVQGSSGRRMFRRNPPPADHQLVQWDFDKAEVKVANPRVTSMRMDCTGRHLAIRAGSRLRLAPGAPDKSQLDELGKSDGRIGRPRGFFDFRRIRVEIDPAAEWAQMVGETARLMEGHHWRGVDTATSLAEARAALDRVGCRSELTDVLHQLHGHVRTSHAYAMGGDHRRRPPVWRPGRLGADVSWCEEVPGWRIDRVVVGDPDDPARRSPLVGPGLVVHDGTVVKAVDGQEVSPTRSLDALLAHRSQVEVVLTVEHDGVEREIVVRPLSDDRPLRYRDWVLACRRRVHERSDGRVGYVHVPNMGPTGFAEFHRDYLSEVHHDALLVDVRWNTGGHVGQLLLATLARPALGWVVPRWGSPYTYPTLAMRGPMAALANQNAGSDGDMFTHLWQRMGLGPVFGVPTWGGTVGIMARHYLVDGSLVTQPEFAQWFDDVGFGLENRGAVPDHPVPTPPGTLGDPQLDAAIDWLMGALRRRPEPPRPEPRPR